MILTQALVINWLGQFSYQLTSQNFHRQVELEKDLVLSGAVINIPTGYAEKTRYSAKAQSSAHLLVLDQNGINLERSIDLPITINVEFNPENIERAQKLLLDQNWIQTSEKVNFYRVIHSYKNLPYCNEDTLIKSFLFTLKQDHTKQAVRFEGITDSKSPDSFTDVIVYCQSEFEVTKTKYWRVLLIDNHNQEYDAPSDLRQKIVDDTISLLLKPILNE